MERRERTFGPHGLHMHTSALWGLAFTARLDWSRLTL